MHAEHTPTLDPEAIARVLERIFREQHGDGYFHVEALRDGRRREHRCIKLGHHKQLEGFIARYSTRRLRWTPAVFTRPELDLDCVLPSPWAWTTRRDKLADNPTWEWKADGALVRLSRLDEPRKPGAWTTVYLPMPRVLLKVPA